MSYVVLCVSVFPSPLQSQATMKLVVTSVAPGHVVKS